jgi:hypothetical protein
MCAQINHRRKSLLRGKKEKRIKVEILQSKVQKYISILPIITVLFTAVVAYISYLTIIESRKQSELLSQSYKHVQRARLILGEFDFDILMHISHTKAKEIILKFPILNKGVTEAYPKLFVISIDSSKKEKIDINDRFLISNKKVLKKFINYELQFPEILYPNDTLYLAIRFGQTIFSLDKKFYVHFYYIYQDVFEDYFEVYTILPYVFDEKSKKFRGAIPIRRKFKILSESDVSILTNYLKNKTVELI